MDSVTRASTESGIWVAALEELAILKAEALVHRSGMQDGSDLLWIRQRMEAEEYQFGRNVQKFFTKTRGSVADI